jgi:hypothetical protein
VGGRLRENKEVSGTVFDCNPFHIKHMWNVDDILLGDISKKQLRLVDTQKHPAKIVPVEQRPTRNPVVSLGSFLIFDNLVGVPRRIF